MPTSQAYQLAHDLMEFSMRNDSYAADPILKKLLRLLREHLEMEVAFISEFIDGCRVFRYVDAIDEFCPIAVGGGDPLDESYCQRVVSGTLPELIHNALENIEALSIAATRALPVGAHISVPIVLSDQTVFGTLCCFQRKPNYELNERDVENVRFLAHCSSLVIEQDISTIREMAGKQRKMDEVIRKQAFHPVFQPIYALESGAIVGLEALTRFTAKPLRTPDVWFGEARDVGWQEALELATVKAILEEVKCYPGEFYVSINLSPNTILHHTQEILHLCTTPTVIVIEITEHDVIDDYLTLNDALAPLRAAGLKIAIDDVGAGYACLKHIMLLKPDIVKIDQAIVKSIDARKESQAMTRALLAFAQEICCDVVAEGIETDAELAMLKSLNVARGQGFLLAVPSRDALKRAHMA